VIIKGKNMLVYFHIDELARDAVVASALKKELEKVGGRLIYGSRFMTDYILRYFNVFDAIILPSLIHYKIAFKDINNLPKNVYILQTEAIGQATGTLRRLNGKYFGHDHVECEPWHKSVKAFLLWGYSHLNPFNEFYPSYISKCRVVGHPRLSKSCNKISMNKNNLKPVVGFVSRFTILSPFDNRTPFESVVSSMKFGKDIFPLFENSPDKDVEDMLYTEVIDFRIMLQVMMSLDANKYSLTVRPHPRENRMGWLKLAEKLKLNINLSPWDEPFGHWLQNVDYIVTPPSTSLYDVFYNKKNAIVINDVVASRADHILTESDDNNQILEGACRPKSVEEIISLIDSGKIPYDENNIQLRLQEQVALDITENSIINIINAISDFGEIEKRSVKKNILLQVFMGLSLFLSYLKFLKAKLSGRVEQGASFDLTIRKIKWISRLTTS
jgi:hypothetical protein